MNIWGLRLACVAAVIGVIVILIRYPGRPQGKWIEPAEAVQSTTGVVTLLRLSGDGEPDHDVYAASIRLADGHEIDVDSASWCYWLWMNSKPGDRVAVKYRDVGGLWSSDFVVENVELIR